METCSHDHDCGGSDCGGSSLHGYVNHPRITALNAEDDDAAQRVFRPWCALEPVRSPQIRFFPGRSRHDARASRPPPDPPSLTPSSLLPPSLRARRDDRLNRDVVPLRSDDDDPELIVHVPFVSDVKVRGIMVIGGLTTAGAAPSRLNVFVNKAPGDINCDNASRKTPTQSFDLAEDFDGVLEYQTDFTKFQACASVTLHFPRNFRGETGGGDGVTEIFFVGLRGEGTGNRRDMIVTAVYETKPMPGDHKTVAEDGAPALGV
jgi:hypothetical protein